MDRNVKHAGIFCSLLLTQPSMRPGPKRIANYLCMHYRKITFFRKHIHLIVEGWYWSCCCLASATETACLLKIDFCFVASRLIQYLRFSNRGSIVYSCTVLVFACNVAQCWSEEEKDKHNTSSSVHGNGEKWGNGQFATPADMHESVSPLFHSLLWADLSLKSSGRCPPMLWAGTVGTAGQRSWSYDRGDTAFMTSCRFGTRGGDL